MRLRRTVGDFWSRAPNACNVAIGYPPPVLRTEERPPVLSFTPMRLGPRPWPPKGPNRSALVNGRSLPLQNVQLDRLLLLHALEFDPSPSRLLDECWRVLDGAGRLLVMVPNRNGVVGARRKDSVWPWQALFPRPASQASRRSRLQAGTRADRTFHAAGDAWAVPQIRAAD